MTMSTSSFYNVLPNVYAQGATHCDGNSINRLDNVYTCSIVGPNPSTTTAECDDGCTLSSSPTTHQQAGRETGQIQQTCHTEPGHGCTRAPIE